MATPILDRFAFNFLAHLFSGSCESDKFQCESGDCLDPTLRCDGNIDCTDGSDEEPEFCDRKCQQDGDV